MWNKYWVKYQIASPWLKTAFKSKWCMSQLLLHELVSKIRSLDRNFIFWEHSVIIRLVSADTSGNEHPHNEMRLDTGVKRQLTVTWTFPQGSTAPSCGSLVELCKSPLGKRCVRKKVDLTKIFEYASLKMLFILTLTNLILSCTTVLNWDFCNTQSMLTLQFAQALTRKTRKLHVRGS